MLVLVSVESARQAAQLIRANNSWQDDHPTDYIVTDCEELEGENEDELEYDEEQEFLGSAIRMEKFDDIDDMY